MDPAGVIRALGEHSDSDEEEEGEAGSQGSVVNQYQKKRTGPMLNIFEEVDGDAGMAVADGNIAELEYLEAWQERGGTASDLPPVGRGSGCGSGCGGECEAGARQDDDRSRRRQGGGWGVGGQKAWEEHCASLVRP